MKQIAAFIPCDGGFRHGAKNGFNSKSINMDKKYNRIANDINAVS